MPVFDLFSKRDIPLPDVFQTEVLSLQFRNQVLWILRETLFKYPDPISSTEAWRAICKERGELRLFKAGVRPEEDLVLALQFSTDVTLVLQVIESLFRAMFVLESQYISFPGARSAADELNHRFRENGIGYQFDSNSLRLIPINAPLVHSEAIRPALALLAHPDFATANKEYMEAWEDFKKSDFDDCLTKCCSCFESVMKIICDKKGWKPKSPKGVVLPLHACTAQPLIETIVNELGMEKFFESPLMLIATMRNRLSSSHGAGTAPKNPPEHIARYALNATASAILLLVEATGV